MALSKGVDDISVPIGQWSEKLYDVYSSRMEKRQPEEFWMNVLAHLSGIGEAIRKTHYDDLIYHASHALSWMICYVGKCNSNDDQFFHITNNLTELVGLKYPTECGHCEKRPCLCDAIGMDEVSDKAAKYGNLYNKWTWHIKDNDFTINKWMEVFKDIYGGRIHLQTMDSLGFHLLEEGGEEARAIRQLVRFRDEIELGNGIEEGFLSRLDNIDSLVTEYKQASKNIIKKEIDYPGGKKKEVVDVTVNTSDQIKYRIALCKMDLVIELADTFSWFCAVVLKLNMILNNHNFYKGIKSNYDLERRLKKEYSFKNKDGNLKCSFCKKSDCKCCYI